MTVFKVIMFGLLGVVVLYVFGFLMTGGDLAIYSFWAPKQANAERNVFEHSQSYVEGKITNLNQLCHDFNTTTGSQHLAFGSEIRNEASTIHISQLPSDEQTCVEQAKGE